MTDDEYLRRAIKLAIEHSIDGIHGPFGALLTQNDAIIAEGWNRVVEQSDPTAHAEIVAIRIACQKLGRIDLSDCTLYSSCQPCPMCLSAVYWARIPRVVFAATDQDAENAGFLDRKLYDEFRHKITDKSIELLHLDIEKATEPFQRWLNNPRRRPY